MRQAIALLKRRLGPDPGSERPHPERGLPPHRWRGALRPLCDDGAPSGTMLALVPNSDEPIDELRHLPRLHVALAAVAVALPVYAGWQALAHAEPRGLALADGAIGPPSSAGWLFLVGGLTVVALGVALSAALVL